MRNHVRKMRGYLAIVTAFIACPCHLPVTLPLLIGLAGGTALGTFLSQNALLIYASSTLYFLGGLWLGWRWLGRGEGELALNPGTRAQRRASGRRKVILLSSSLCNDSPPARELWRSLQEQHDFDFEEVDLLSRRGRQLVSQMGIRKVPTTLIDGRVTFQGIPDRERAAAAVR